MSYQHIRVAPLAGALALVIVSGISACSDHSDPASKDAVARESDGPLSVYVVNYPLKYIAERIGGEQVLVTLPAPADVDPAFWMPAAQQIAAYQRAHLILLNGASYARWVQRVSLPASRMVDTSAAFSGRLIPMAGQSTHSHGTTGEHRHGDVAFTTWLDPLQAIEQAASVRDALIRLRPDAATDFRHGFVALEKDLRELDERLAAAFAARSGQPLLFSHPVYQYLIRRYGIDGHAVHWEPDTAPDPDQWQALDRLLAEHPARSMLWEGAPDPAIVAELKRRGVETIVFEPGANQPSEGDYLGVMRNNLRGLSGEPGQR